MSKKQTAETMETRVFSIVMGALNQGDTVEQLRIQKAANHKEADKFMADSLKEGGTKEEFRALCQVLTEGFEAMKIAGTFGAGDVKTASGQYVQKQRQLTASRMFHGAFKRVCKDKKLAFKLSGYAPFKVTMIEIAAKKTIMERAEELFSGTDKIFLTELASAYKGYQERQAEEANNNAAILAKLQKEQQENTKAATLSAILATLDAAGLSADDILVAKQATA